MTLCRSFHAEALQATVSEGLAQNSYVGARAGFEPTTPGRKASTLPKRHHAPSIEHRVDFSKVAEMHEARAGKMSNVIGEANVWWNIAPKLRTGEFGVNVWVEAESRLMEIDGSWRERS